MTFCFKLTPQIRVMVSDTSFAISSEEGRRKIQVRNGEGEREGKKVITGEEEEVFRHRDVCLQLQSQFELPC